MCKSQRRKRWDLQGTMYSAAGTDYTPGLCPVKVSGVNCPPLSNLNESCGPSFAGENGQRRKKVMFDATNNDILAAILITFTLYATSPLMLTLKPWLIARCAKVVPGGTEADVLFYWKHWLIRLVIVSTGLAGVMEVWGLLTDTDTTPQTELLMMGIWSLFLGYVGWAGWRKWRG